MLDLALFCTLCFLVTLLMKCFADHLVWQVQNWQNVSSQKHDLLVQRALHRGNKKLLHHLQLVTIELPINCVTQSVYKCLRYHTDLRWLTECSLLVKDSVSWIRDCLVLSSMWCVCLHREVDSWKQIKKTQGAVLSLWLSELPCHYWSAATGPVCFCCYQLLEVASGTACTTLPHVWSFVMLTLQVDECVSCHIPIIICL